VHDSKEIDALLAAKVVRQPESGGEGVIENLCLDAAYTGKGDIVAAWGYIHTLARETKRLQKSNAIQSSRREDGS
jgi:hypothetical protein